jgi:3-oxoadipate enol-lactonase
VLSELERNDPGMVLRAGWELSRFRSDAWVGEIDVPTAVVMTAHDHVVVPSNQLGLATAIPDAVVHEVEAGHGACLTEPERFVPTLVAACSQVAQRAGLSVGSA